MGAYTNNIPGGMTLDPNGPSAKFESTQAFNKENPWLLGGGPIGWIQQYARKAKGDFEKAGMYQKAQEDTAQNQINNLGSWYKKESGTSFLDTEQSKSAMEQLRRTLAETLMGQQNNAVTGGATDESQLAGRQAATQNYGNVVNSLVGQATQRKDMLTSQYQNQLNDWLGKQMGLQAQRSQGYATAGQNLVQAPFEVLNSVMNMAKSGMSMASGIPNMGGGGSSGLGSIGNLFGGASGYTGDVPGFKSPTIDNYGGGNFNV